MEVIKVYALSNSLLEQIGDYRVEVYTMEIFEYEADVEIALKIFGENEIASYVGEFEITMSDGKTTSGACLNRATKEETFLAVEEAVIKILKDGNHHKE